MAKLLYIESSPRKSQSKSIAVSHAFLEVYKTTHPVDEIKTLDLWETTLPDFNSFTIEAKYKVLHGLSFGVSEHKAWQDIIDICDEFKSADKYLFSVPMWNFGIPYKLKHYIDVLTQPGQTFNFDPTNGYSGLVIGKPVTVIYARGGSYSSPNSKGLDLQKGYMDILLRFLGFTDITTITLEPTLGSVDEVAVSEAGAIEFAKNVATSF